MQELQLYARGLWEELSSEADPQLQPEQQARTLFSSLPSESETWGTDKFTSHTSFWNDHTFHTSYLQQQTVSMLVLPLPSWSLCIFCYLVALLEIKIVATIKTTFFFYLILG